MGLAVPAHDPSHVQRVAWLLLLAWLPSLAFLGHWDAMSAPFTSMVAEAAHTHTPLDRTHEQHCHTGVDGCSDGGSTAPVPAPALESAIASPESGQGERVLLNDAPLAAHAASPITPPPRHAR